MKKVIIIGAGPAGLTAGYELLKQSNAYEVTILEKSNVIGGISRTINHNGNRMDIGGHRFFSKDRRVMDWWTTLLPLQGSASYDDKKLQRNHKHQAGGPDPETQDRVFLWRNRISRIYYQGKFFDYPISLKMQTILNLGFMQTMLAGCSYLKSTFIKLRDTNLENFYINRFGKKLYQLFFEGYTEKVWGRHPREISADWGSQRIKGLSIKAILNDIFRKLMPKKTQEIETSLIESFYYPKFGPGHLWETVADDFRKMGGKIVFDAEVIKIIKNDHKILGLISVNEHYDADIVISSMPIKDLINAFEDSDSQIKEIANGLPYRDFITIGILTDRLALRNTTSIPTINDIVPDCWIYIQDTHVKLGRIQIFNNWSPYMVKDIDNTVWIGLEYFCNEGDSFWNMDPLDAKQLAISELIKIGVLNQEANILDFHREKVQKAYPAYFDTYAQMPKIIDYLDHFTNLYCIGRNGQHRYNNMDHSMVTAFETVSNIINNVPTKNNIWEVNTEKEYHEKSQAN